MKNLYFAIPFYNEENNIEPLISKIRDLHFDDFKVHIIAVNDGSSDSTKEILNKLKSDDMLIINHKVNQGLGKTLKDAFFKAYSLSEKTKTHKDNIIITLDGDNSHDPEYVYKMKKLISESGFDLVVASRYQRGSKIFGVPFHRKVLSIFASLIFMIFQPIKGIRDYSCGYRGFSCGFIKKAIERYGTNLIKLQGFACTLELILKISTISGKFTEIPFDLRYDLKMSDSKIKIISTSLVYFKFLLKKRNKL